MTTPVVRIPFNRQQKEKEGGDPPIPCEVEIVLYFTLIDCTLLDRMVGDLSLSSRSERRVLCGPVRVLTCVTDAVGSYPKNRL